MPSGRRWDRLPRFWQTQIVGWGLFTLVDLVDRGLTYRSLGISMVLTLLLAPCCCPRPCEPPMRGRARPTAKTRAWVRSLRLGIIWTARILRAHTHM